MSCPGCEIHRVVHGVTKKADAKPKDEPIPTSSRKITLSQTTQDHRGIVSQENPIRGPLVSQQK